MKDKEKNQNPSENIPSPPQPGILKMAALSALAILAGVGVALGTWFLLRDAGPAPASASGEISFPAARFADGLAQHFTYEAADGRTIRYFVMQSGDGVIRAAFDACDVCWPEGKGYVQEGDNMVCRNCGRRFPSRSINEVQGGCNPAPLNRALVDGRVVITTADLEAGAGYFDFGREDRG